MSRFPGLLFILCALAWAGAVQAQSLRVRTGVPKVQAQVEPWSGYFRYNIASDYAKSEQPRAFVQVLGGGAKYAWSENWSMSTDLTLKIETVDGKIEKGPEQSKMEVLNPSAAMELDYERTFNQRHHFTLFTHGEPLFDEPSRLEGYRGIVGVGGELTFAFFGKRYTISQVLDISELINSYDYSLDEEANPDMFYTYKLSNGIHFFRTMKFSYSFGLKLTRRLDASTDYSYNNTFMIANSWKKMSVALVYENGGFTDDGAVSLWYIDQYRRVAQLMVNYSF